MRRVRFGVGIYTCEPLPKVIEHARLAESLGYDSLWLLDSQMVGREVYATMASCALNTSRITIGSGVTNPYTRHVTVTAGAHLSLAELAPGRIVVGIARGDSAVLGLGADVPSFKSYGQYVRDLRRLLAGEQLEINGKPARVQFVDAAHPPEIPIYVAAGGPQALALSPSLSDRIIIHSGAGEIMITRAVDQVRAGAERHGKNLADIELVWWVHASIDPDWSRVKAHYGPRIVGKLRHKTAVSLEELGVRLDPETYAQAKDAYNFLEHATAGASHAAYADLFPEDVWRQMALLGSAEECYRTVRTGLERNPEISHFVINPPPPGFGITNESVMREFAAGVMRRLESDGVVAAAPAATHA